MFYNAIFDAMVIFMIFWFGLVTSYIIFAIAKWIMYRKKINTNLWIFVTTILLYVTIFIMLLMSIFADYKFEQIFKKDENIESSTILKIKIIVSCLVLFVILTVFLCSINGWWFRVQYDELRITFGFFDFNKNGILISKRKSKKLKLEKKPISWDEVTKEKRNILWF